MRAVDRCEVALVRFLVGIAVLLMMGSAITLFVINYDTRRLAVEVARKEDALVKLRNDIAVYKAERAHLSRPERIAPYARALGMRPARQSQFEDPSQLERVDAHHAAGNTR